MAPKSRRGKARFRRPAQQPAAASVTPITATAFPTTTVNRPIVNAATTAQYDYVTKDLKLIAIIAGSMILLIVILSFIL